MELTTDSAARLSSSRLVTDSDDGLARLMELAGAVLEAAQQLTVTATAAREAAPSPPVSRAESAAALISDLRCREVVDPAEVSRRAADLGCDLSLGALALCVELSVDRPTFVAALITQGCDEALVTIHATSSQTRVYAILPTTATCIAGSVGSVRELSRRLAPYGIVGVSSFQAQVAQLGPALREAELVLDVIRNSGEQVAEEVGSGTYRLLLRMLASHPEEIVEFHASTIAPLAAYDGVHGTDLVATLTAYLESDCNMNATAAAVYAHRHTIASRLERIHDLTGLNPLNHEGRERLGLGIKTHRLLAPQLHGGVAGPA